MSGSQSGLDTKLGDALTSAIKELGVEATSLSENIDALKDAIKKNIDDIAEGANKAGAATSELVVGVLTTIVNAKPDSKPAKNGNGDGSESGENGKDSGSGENGGGSNEPSTDFVVSAIKGASEGVAETAQARAALNANNEKLAAAIQKLARINALVAVAQVVAVQNSLFSAALQSIQQSVAAIAATWGAPPIAPPASGISLGLADFAKQIAAVSSQQEANTLVGQMEYAFNDWKLFYKDLARQKGRLVSVAQL